MKQQLLLLFVVMGFLIGSAGCTSKKVDQESADISELAGDAGAEDIGAIDDFGSDGESVSTDVGGDGLEELGASDEMATTTDENTGLDDAGAGSSGEASTDDFSGLDDSAASGQTEELATNDYAPEPTTPTDDLAMSGSSDETQGLSEEPAAPKPIIPLQKMMTTPYRKNGVLVNGLYIAREGDTTKSVSQKIYGADKVDELKNINSTLARRSMKTGDKVYYSSSIRPDDETTIMTYYEEKGLAPEVYLSKPGDNIRTVAKEILGSTNSWKELWATNLDVESKGELMEGTRLRYWSAVDAGSSVPPVAEMPQTPPPSEELPPPQDELAATAPGTTMPDSMPEEAPPPPSVADLAPPPPPPPMEVAPPPPAAAASAQVEDGALGDDPDQLMTLLTGAVLLIAAIAMFIIIRKKRARRNSGIEFQTAANTQID